MRIHSSRIVEQYAYSFAFKNFNSRRVNIYGNSKPVCEKPDKLQLYIKFSLFCYRNGSKYNPFFRNWYSTRNSLHDIVEFWIVAHPLDSFQYEKYKTTNRNTHSWNSSKKALPFGTSHKTRNTNTRSIHGLPNCFESSMRIMLNRLNRLQPKRYRIIKCVYLDLITWFDIYFIPFFCHSQPPKVFHLGDPVTLSIPFPSNQFLWMITSFGEMRNIRHIIFRVLEKQKKKKYIKFERGLLFSLF